MNPHSPKVHSMTTRSRILALSMAALMVATTMVTIAPSATAQDVVPTKPEVPFTVVPGVEQRLYLRYSNLGPEGAEQNTPDCNNVDADPQPRTLRMTPAVPPQAGGIGGRATCPYSQGNEVAFSTQAQNGAGTANTLQPKRDIRITGNGTMQYFHNGMVGPGLSIEVQLRTGGNPFEVGGGTLVANASFTNTAQTSVSDFTVELRLQGEARENGVAILRANQPITVVLRETTGGGATGQLPTIGAPSWRISDVGSHLRLVPDDAFRAATWVTDERSVVRSIFTPVPTESQNPADQDRRIVGHFALQSSFGYADASAAEAARFRLFFNGAPREIGTNGATILEGVLNQSASAPANGTAVWSFPVNTLKYNGFPGGEYTLRVDKKHQGVGQSAITAGIERTFAIAAQSIDLRVFSDTRAGIAETQAHTVVPGSSTTYLLMVNNTGVVNDTYTMNLTAPNAPSGWGGTLGGPDAQGNRITVPRGETRIFTLTVTAPVGASGQIIHLVNLTSTLDPNVRSRDLTLVTTAGTDVSREVGVVFLSRNLEVDPGVETLYPVYVWNRGTRPANLSLELRETAVNAWTVDLLFGNSNVDRIPIGGVQPGAIAGATLKVRGDSAASPTHTVTLNATNTDVSGFSNERPVTFSIRVNSGVAIQVLDSVAGQEHVAEVEATLVRNPVDGSTSPDPSCDILGCTADGVDGLWYRVWVTNTGRRAERFSLSSELFESNCPDDAFAFFDPRTAPPAALGFYFRSPGGTPSSGATSMELGPGETGEVYFLLPVVRGASPCDGAQGFDSEVMTFVIEARGESGVIARKQLRGIAESGDRSRGVFIEGATRLSYTSTKPLVDITNATTRAITGGIRPGGTTYYYLRVTNLASWTNHETNDGPQTADLRLALDSGGVAEGWNVSMRPVLEEASMTEALNPFSKQFNLTNIEPGTNLPRAWTDREIQVRVQAPSVSNGTAVTNAQEVTLVTAFMNNSDTRSTFRLQTVVTDFAEVNLRSEVPRVYAHRGDPSAFLVYINNTGGSETPVTMRATMQNAPTGWTLEPNAQTFSLAAFKNRTVALRVTPPQNAPVGTPVNVNITVSYAEFPKLSLNASKTTTLIVPVEVVDRGALELETTTTEATVAPGGFANFTMTLRNVGSTGVIPFRVTASDIPNWTITPSRDDPLFGNLSQGGTRTITLVARVPNDVTNESRFSTIVRVEDVSSVAAGTQNFDTAAFNVNILGGKAIPSLSVPNLVKRVDRGAAQSFEVGIRNVGSAGGRIPLEWRALDPSWNVVVRDSLGAGSQQISSVFLAPNELVNVYVNVSAPFTVPERAVVPIEIAAYTPDLTQRATATLSAEIHDYGVSLVLTPSSRDGLPGVATEFVARLRNTGNDNDTLNLSVNLVDLVGWNVEHVQEVRLEPNQETDVRMTIRGPDEPLPTPRAYTFPVWVGTRGGQAVNLSKNMTQSAVVTIPNYRAFDMDGDQELEIAVDADKRTANGFEEFREIFVAGSATREIGKPIFEGRTTFLLDVPTADEPHNGVADVWFNPETVHAFTIEFAPDINGDGTPDYLLDTDRDGKIDSAYDSVTERFWAVNEVKVFGDDAIQYLVDVTGDGRPDRFFDPAADNGEGRVTRTQSAPDLGDEYVGIDVDDDQTVDYYYNTRTEDVSGAEVQNISGFAGRYWYFFVAFAALVLVSILLIVRRRRA